MWEVFANLATRPFAPRVTLRNLPQGVSMTSEERASRIVRAVTAALAPGFGVRLWTGERLGPAGGPTIAINDPGVLRRLMRAPSLVTIVELWISGAVDVEDGTLFDIVERRPAGKLKERLRALPKARLLLDAAPLLFSRGRTGLSGLAGAKPFVSGSTIMRSTTTTTSPTVSISSSSTSAWSTPAATSPISQRYRPGAGRQARPHLPEAAAEARRALLDIGCGWGALLIHAAKHYGVTGAASRCRRRRRRWRANASAPRVSRIASAST